MKKILILLCICTVTFMVTGGQVAFGVNNSNSRFHMTKKGLCMTTKKGNAKKWKARTELLDVSWHYSWAGRLPGGEAGIDGVEFVPMIWGYWGNSDDFKGLIRELHADNLSGRRKNLLGFNEPDQKNQSNLSVDRALKAWPYLMWTGLRLGSPGAVHPDNDWMQEFMRKAEERNLRVDFVTVHWYGGPNVESLIQRLHKVHKMYGKPIWITEFAVGDWNAKSPEQNKHSPEKVLGFMKEALPRLDELDFVERYAWYNGGEGNSALCTSNLVRNDGTLTPLGKFYKDHK